MSKNTIVVRIHPRHPGQMRRRAGFTFGQKAEAIDVTPEQEQAIRKDEWLFIVTKGSAYTDAMKAYGADVQDDVVEDEADDQVDADMKRIEKMTKAELIEALSQNGMTEGEDFDGSATKADLKNLLLECL